MKKLCYLFDPVTGEFLGEENAQRSPMEPGKYLFPEYSTIKAPPTPGANEVAVFDKALDAWGLKSDFRGSAMFNTTTGDAVQISDIGALPANVASKIPAKVVLNIAKAEKLSLLNEDCAAAIIGGFESYALGPTHLYASGIIDQANLMAVATESMAPENSPLWSRQVWCVDSADGWVVKAHSGVQVRRVLADFVTHKENCSAKMRQLSIFVANAKSLKALDSINW